ncbi:MAG: T9SS type A sorting domain-containing protein [Bacteroidetes bacterium]|nr:T9SS type A sorting domain-containing protein [Bacteroidota bacterium]
MKTKFLQLLLPFLFLTVVKLNAQKVCTDWNAYVESKNTGGTGYVTLTNGYEERASQTYHYSGPGRVGRVRVYGNNTGIVGVPIRISVFNVDSKGRPTSTLAYVDDFWWNFLYNTGSGGPGYIEVAFSGGVTVSADFAIGVSLRTGAGAFQVKYTGNGEGRGADLASLAGTSTGGNWASAMSSFSKDGDFYLIPRMSHDVTSKFSVSTQCATTSTTVSFTNGSDFTMDSMFNTIGWYKYAGSNKYYTWDFGDGSAVSNAASPTHTYTSAGAYTAKLICTVHGWNTVTRDTWSVKISVGLAASTTGLTNVSCNGLTNGSISAVGSGGATPYSYSLDGVTYQSGAAFSNLKAGNYTVYVKDALGCIATNTFTITQPTPVAFTSVASSNAACGASDGSILAAAGGGAGSITYRLGTGSYQSSGSFTGLAAGAYVVTAKDANGCLAMTNVNVNNSSSPVLTVASFTNVSCFGGNDGSISLTASGGTGAHQFSINGGTSFQSSGAFANLAAGTYEALVKDAAGCTSGKTIEIKQPGKISFANSTNAVNCFNGSDGEIHFLNTIGGIGKFAYSVNGTNFQSSPDFTGLKAGTYTVYVKDIANCQASSSVSVIQPADIVTNLTITNAQCNKSTSGSILAVATGGTPSYAYSLNGGDYQPTGQFSDLAAGNYKVMVYDNHGCTDTASATITEPSAITATSNTTNSTCSNANGSLGVTASGGSGSGYTYSMDGVNWQGSGNFSNLTAGTYYVLIRDGAGCQTVVAVEIKDSNGPSITGISSTNVACNGGNDGSITINSTSGGTGTLQYSLNGTNWQTSNQFAALKAGSYVVIVKDANGCRGNSGTINITQPNAFTITKDVTNVTCNGTNNGSVTINAVGGAGTMAYSIDGGTTFQSDKTFNNLYAGNYYVIVRDAAGCTGNISFSVTEPSRISTILGVLDVSCYGQGNGAITINASGGTGAYQYSINGTSWQSGKSFTNLAGATYTIYVKDANNCIVSQKVTVNEPQELGINGIVSNVSCAGGNNGVIDLTIAGGVRPYQFAWSNGATTEDNFNLKAGSYSVTVTDANGCKGTENYTLTQPANPIVVNGVVTNTSGSTGAIDLTVTGGVTPYQFSWSNGDITEDLSNLTPGVYTVIITDANKCVTSTQFTVSNSTGVADIAALNSTLKLYPNPANDKAVVEVAGYAIRRIQVMNTTGRVVYTATPDRAVAELNTTLFAEGTYFVQVEVEGSVITRKLVVLK